MQHLWRLSLLTLLALAALAFTACGDGVETEDDQALAESVARDAAYATEMDEATGYTAPAGGAERALAITGLKCLDPAGDTNWVAVQVVRTGNLGGTATIDVQMSWGLTAGSVAYNRSWEFWGSRTITYSSFQNGYGRTIASGTNVVTVDRTAPGTLVSVNLTNAGVAPAVGATVRRTLSVSKHLVGDITVIGRLGKTKTMHKDLTLTVNSRVVDWTFDGVQLSSPVLVSRDVTITGTVIVNGNVKTINKTIVVTAND